MKVSELIEMLKDFDEDAQVHFNYGYGDYWRTQVAPAVCQVFDGMVVYSDYHQMDKLIEDDSDEDAPRRVVVIAWYEAHQLGPVSFVAFNFGLCYNYIGGARIRVSWIHKDHTMNKDFKKYIVRYNIRMTDHTYRIHNYATQQSKLDEANEMLIELSDYAEARSVIDYIKNL